MNNLKEITEIVRNGSVEQLATVLDKFPDLVSETLGKESRWPTSLLLIAIEHYDTDKVKLIIKRGADATKQPGNSILRFLSQSDHQVKFNVELLKLLVEKGAKFPDDPKGCSLLIRQCLNRFYNDDDIKIINLLIDLGFDPIATEKIAKSSIIVAALTRCWEGSNTRVADRFFDLGCRIKGLKGEYSTPLGAALEQEHYKYALKIKQKEPDAQVFGDNLVFTIANDHPKMPAELREALLSEKTDYHKKDYDGDTLLHLTCYQDSLDFMSFLAEKGVDMNATNENGDTPLSFAIKEKFKKSILHLITLGADINLLDKKGRTPLDIAMKQSGFKQVCAKMVKAGAKTSVELSTNTGDEVNAIEVALSNIQAGEPWADKLRELIAQQGKQQAAHWNLLLAHCVSNNTSKPSKKWNKETAALVETIGESIFRDTLLIILPLVKEKRTEQAAAEDTPENYYYGGTEKLITENNTRLLKGLLWVASRYSDQDVCRELRNLASNMYKKVFGIGMRNAKLANAALYSLSQMSGTAGLKEIVIMRAATKYNPALVNINRVFDKLASEKGMTADELAELSIPDYGLDEVGLYTQTLETYIATICLSGVGKSELTWTKGEKSQKSAPITLKAEFADEIKALKLKVKDLNVATSAHSLRLEQMYLRDISYERANWQTQYIEHKLMGFLSRRLIWRICVGKVTTDIIYTEAGFVDAQNNLVNLPKEASIKLWHPIMSDAAAVVAWREWLIQHEVTQPFKQAHREIYILTDAERETGNYSLRFANHILKHSQFNALATQRGWKQTRGGSWDGGSENSAYKYIPAYKMNIEFVAEGAENYNMSDTGIYQCVGTSQVIFSKNSPVNLEKIKPLLFSEVMRDVDLFVGVCSIANDPEWQNRAIEYWNDNSFGELSVSAKTRYEVLDALIPKLKFAPQLRLDGRFLIVEGQVRTYKIHLGSSNILMEPNDSYLCIVAKPSNKTVMLPFEGDITLSLILSKAFTLANDSKIKDKTILSQIKPGDATC